MMKADLAGFYRRSRAARKIMVVDLGFLGDSIHLVPALWEIKRHYPEAALHTLSAPLGREVLALAPCVDRAWAFPLGPPSPSWWRHWEVIRALRRESFDLAFNFSGADRTIFLTALTGAKWRVGHLAGRDHFWKSLLVGAWAPRQDARLPVFEQRRRMLAGCGFELQSARFDLRVSPEARRWAEEVTPPEAVHFSINASLPAKEWPLEHWVALAQTLLGEDHVRHIVASGSGQPREQERLRWLEEKTGHPRLKILPPNLTIERLAAVLGGCRLHLGADSGVLHLALAVGIPTLAIFREYAGKDEWLPVGPNHRHVTAPCACAVQNRLDAGCQHASACLARISPAQVAAGVAELIGP